MDHTSVSSPSRPLFWLFAPEKANPPWLPLVRLRRLHKGQWYLAVRSTESFLEEAAASTLKRATNLQPGYLEQLYAFGDVLRTPKARAATRCGRSDRHPALLTVMVSVVWASIPPPRSRTLAREIRWFPVDELPERRLRPQRNHWYALYRLQGRSGTAARIAIFLGWFTVRSVVEGVGSHPGSGDFRRQIAASIDY